MDPRGLTLWVDGVPVPQGSKAARVVNGRAQLFDHGSSQLAGWRKAVRAEATVWWGGRSPMVDAVAVQLRFVTMRPASARRRQWPGVRPDVDKLARAVLDALTGVVWADDSQVVRLLATKEYRQALQGPTELPGNGPGVAIVVRAME